MTWMAARQDDGVPGPSGVRAVLQPIDWLGSPLWNCDRIERIWNRGSTAVTRLTRVTHEAGAMLEQVERRLRECAADVGLSFDRIAVAEYQITTLDLPTRPPMRDDRRANGLTSEGVEVGGASPATLRALANTLTTRRADTDVLDVLAAEESERYVLTKMAAGGPRG